MYYLLTRVPSSAKVEHSQIQAEDVTQCQAFVFEQHVSELHAPLTFRVNASDPLLDYLEIGNVAGGKLCSQGFIDVLRNERIPFVAYPAVLLERSTGKQVTTSYYFWLPSFVEDAIDWERSEDWTMPQTGKRFLTKLVLTAACEATAPPLFRATQTGRYLIHETLATQLQAAGITGVAFAPLDGVHILHLGVKKLAIERLLEDNPKNGELWLELSGLQISLHRYPDALDSLRRVLTLKPELDKGWAMYGHTLLLVGKRQEALEALRRAKDMNMRSHAWADYCTILRDLGRNEEALVGVQQWVQVLEESPLPWFELGASYIELGHYQEGLQAVEQGLKLGGGSRYTDLLTLKGKILFHLQRYDEALQMYTMALIQNPLDMASLSGKIQTLRALGLNEEAEQAEMELHRLEQRREKNMRARPI